MAGEDPRSSAGDLASLQKVTSVTLQRCLTFRAVRSQGDERERQDRVQRNAVSGSTELPWGHPSSPCLVVPRSAHGHGCHGVSARETLLKHNPGVRGAQARAEDSGGLISLPWALRLSHRSS